MSRRRDISAGLFHVTCHSVWELDLFRDDVDRVNYLAELVRTMRRRGWICPVVCLMTTHAHFMFEIGDDSLAEGMQELNFRYAVSFNARHRRRGRVFGAPYSPTRIRDDSHLLTAYRYVVMNPVEAGLVDRPEDWRWSSYATTIGLSQDFAFVNANRVLGALGGPPEVARARLRAFVEVDLPVTIS
jgi:REP element-mobilizing transposase RayT